MNKKKIFLLSSLLVSVSAVSAGLIANAHSDSILKVAHATDTSYTLTINKDTVKTDKPWFGSYVYTTNGNIFLISKVDGTTDEIYSLNDKRNNTIYTSYTIYISNI